jgi:ADP-ribose pyrophosphatase
MPDGQEVGREVIEHPGAVGIVAIDEAGQVLLIRQYRHPVGRQLWEIPAGLRDVDGEPPLATARRELLEEAGYLAADWQVLADFFTSPGITSERLRVYLARGLVRVPDAEREYVPDHEEAHLTIEWAPLGEVVSRILAGDLHNGVMMIGVLAAFAAKRDGFALLRAADAPER